jgi:hypothetical protein
VVLLSSQSDPCRAVFWESINQTGRRAAAYFTPNPSVQPKADNGQRIRRTAQLQRPTLSCLALVKTDESLEWWKDHVYDDGVGVDTGTAVESVVPLSIPQLSRLLPPPSSLINFNLTYSTHPRHGLPYPSSRASANAPTKAKRTGQFDSQTLIFILV